MGQTGSSMTMEGRRCISTEELQALKEKMNSRALVRRRAQTLIRVLANVMVALVVLLPLLYAVSIAFMPSNELFSVCLLGA